MKREDGCISSIMHALAGLGPRPHGSQAIDRAAVYLREVLEGAGFTIREHNFLTKTPVASAELFLSLSGRSFAADCEPFLESPPGRVEGELAFDGYLRVWGIYEWECWAIRQGHDAVAYLVGCDLGEAIPQHLPPTTPSVPHAVVPRSTIDLLHAAQQNDAPPLARLTVSDSQPAEGTSLRAFVDRDPLDAGPSPLMVAHYDTVPGSPGVYDNAAGVAAGIAAALALAQRGPAPHLLLTGGEELGLAGARAVVTAWAQKGRLGRIPAVIVLDGGGRGRLAEAWISAPAHDTAIVASFRAACGSHGYGSIVRRPAPPGSDHAAFTEAGVASVMFTVNDTSILHRPIDIFDERKVSAAQWMADAAQRTFAALT